MARKGNPVKVGCVTFPSMAAAARAYKVDYMTMYMRLRDGWSPAKATGRKVRKYTKSDDNVSLTFGVAA